MTVMDGKATGEARRVVLSSLWAALERLDVSFDNGPNTWIDGHFEADELADAFLAKLRETHAIVPREASEAMVIAAYASQTDAFWNAETIYLAMIAAASPAIGEGE